MEKNKGSCRGGNSSPLAENSVWIRGNQIGRGSYGSVSIGITRHDGAVFAVKSVDSSSSSPSHLDSLENEIRILRSLPPSPFVVRYLADDHTFSPENPKRLFRNLHVEYLPGGTAADLGKDVRKESDIRRYAWCLVAALSHLHSNGIVHCDVKGANVLLDSTRTVAKLADFGSAAERNDGGGRIEAPRGSPLWMAPEVVRGEKQGRESDVWSLGCTVIEMATGAPAWKDEGVGPTLSRIGYSEESPALPPGLSELCRDFLEKCLRRDPARRWSCERLLDHPFLMRLETADGIKERRWSPRSVIDWQESDVEEELLADFYQESAEQRIGKLASASAGCCGGSIWESDGWVAVRCSSVVIREEEEDELGCRSTSGRRNGDQKTEEEEEEGGGATSGFGNSAVVPAATVGEGVTLCTNLDGFLLFLSLLKMLYHYTNLNYNITKTNAYIFLPYLPSFPSSYLRVTPLFPFLFFSIKIRLIWIFVSLRVVIYLHMKINQP